MINTHNTNPSVHTDIRNSLTSLQENALTALRVHEGAGIKVNIETNGDITLSSYVDNELFIAASILPESGLEHKIYLVPKSDPETGNTLDEYIWTNDNWELVGSISVDLTDYYKKAEVDAQTTSAINTIKSVDKSITLATSDWVEQEDGTYNVVINDSDILENSKISIMLADLESCEMYSEANIFGGISSAGQFLLRAKEIPSEDMNINYTIAI